MNSSDGVMRASLAALLGKPVEPDAHFALGVSGGPDSLAMLVLAADEGIAVTALTVDHQLRPESTSEAAYVAEVCAARGVPHRTLTIDVRLSGEGLQAAARAGRYAAMGQWCDANGVRWLLTAHHADDQAETLLMRMARGSGLAGMSGIRSRRPLDGCAAELLRPLLAIRKIDLVGIVEAAGLRLVEDPSNDEPSYDRTAARRMLLGSGIDSARAAATAAHLAEAEAAMEWICNEAWAGRSTIEDDTVSLDVRDLPAEIVRRLALRAIRSLYPHAKPDGPSVERLIHRLQAGDAATLAGVTARPGPWWRFGRTRAASAAKQRPVSK